MAERFGYLFIDHFYNCFCVLQAKSGYLELPNDVLSNVTALHNLAEWQVILILSHKREQPVKQISLFCLCLQHMAFNTLIIRKLWPKYRMLEYKQVHEQEVTDSFHFYFDKQNPLFQAEHFYSSWFYSDNKNIVKWALAHRLTIIIGDSWQSLGLLFIPVFSSQLGEGYSAWFPTQTPRPICSPTGTTFVKVDWIMALASLL